MDPLDQLLSRLASSAPGVRRLAILDLLALARSDPRALQAVITHLPAEPDEKGAILIIRHLAGVACISAMPILWRLYQEASTPARIAHAAIVAHDQLLGTGPSALTGPDHSS